MQMKSIRVRAWLCLVIIVAFLVSWIYIAFLFGNGFMTAGGIRSLRYFTILSNLVCAFAALAVVFTLRKNHLPYGIWLWKYIGTAAVTITLLTVVVFLGPTIGYGNVLAGRDFYLHIVCPFLAIISFCFLERQYTLTFYTSLWGVVPVILYGILYLYKVILCREEARWEDFYGFNRNGNWQLSFAAMAGGAVLAGVLLCILTRVFD